MYSLLHHNTFGIDAQCREFIEYSTVEELSNLIPRLKSEKWLHIGAGSNLLFVDDFDGIILHSKIRDCEILNRNREYIWVRVGSGFVWDDWVAYSLEKGYYGLENLSYIPGEVGASAVQNIGAYGVEVESYIDKVEVLNISSGSIEMLSHDECGYAYRNSIFKKELKGKCIVTHVVFRLPLTFAPDLTYSAISKELDKIHILPESVTAHSLRELIIDVRKSKLPEPEDLGSAGSFFMNPIITKEQFNFLFNKYPNIPHYQMENGVKIPAGWLIEQCGWKGKNLGPVGVYSKQALILVNLGGARGIDVVHLSDEIQQSVFDKFGIKIFPEVNFIQ